MTSGSVRLLHRRVSASNIPSHNTCPPGEAARTGSPARLPGRRPLPWQRGSLLRVLLRGLAGRGGGVQPVQLALSWGRWDSSPRSPWSAGGASLASSSSSSSTSLLLTSSLLLLRPASSRRGAHRAATGNHQRSDFKTKGLQLRWEFNYILYLMFQQTN